MSAMRFAPGQRNNSAISEAVETMPTKELVTREETCAWEEQDGPDMMKFATKLN